MNVSMLSTLVAPMNSPVGSTTCVTTLLDMSISYPKLDESTIQIVIPLSVIETGIFPPCASTPIWVRAQAGVTVYTPWPITA